MRDQHEHEVPDLNLLNDFPAPTLEQWREVIDRDLKGQSFEKKLIWHSPDGPTIKPLYTAQDLESLNVQSQLPGFAPYGRGTWPLSGVNPTWQIRQDCVLASPEEVNAALRDGIARGQTAIGIRLDDAARRGYDADSPEAEKLAGRSGCTLSSINGLRIALSDLDLTKYPITIRTGTASVAVLAMLIALLNERGIDPKLVSGAMDCDPIRELLKRGTVRGSIELQYREMADMASYCGTHCHGIRPVTVNSNIYSRSGASIVYELGATIATGVEYLRAMTTHGVDLNVACRSMLFNFSVTTNLFFEIAKLRAARMLWARVMKAFQVEDEYAGRMFMHVRTSTYTKTKYDVYNNIIRNGIEAFAGAIGGCDSMYVAPFDEPLGRPDEFSTRIARNQQILLQEESYLNRVVDPAGGSYFIESLTDSIAREAWNVFQKLESEGGILSAIKSGSLQKDITEVADRKRKLISQRRTSIVGVSNYAAENEKTRKTSYLSQEKFLTKRRERIKRLKSGRQNTAVVHELKMITKEMETKNGNCVEHAILAADKGATIGEITMALKSASVGETLKTEVLPVERAAAPFEYLREQAAAIERSTGQPPKVVLVLFGPLSMRRARADFCLNFFRAGGLKVIELEPVEHLTESVAKSALAESKLIVACSSDECYAEQLPPFCGILKGLESNTHLIVAGNPASADDLKESGVDGFVHLKSDAVGTLSELLNYFESSMEAVK